MSKTFEHLWAVFYGPVILRTYPCELDAKMNAAENNGECALMGLPTDGYHAELITWDFAPKKEVRRRQVLENHVFTL